MGTRRPFWPCDLRWNLHHCGIRVAGYPAGRACSPNCGRRISHALSRATPCHAGVSERSGCHSATHVLVDLRLALGPLPAERSCLTRSLVVPREARDVGIGVTRSGQGDRGRTARPGSLLQQRPMRRLPSAALLHGQPHAQPARRTFFHPKNDQRTHGQRRGAHQNSRIRRLTCMTTDCSRLMGC
jgi:hypothetical protein